MANEEKMYRVDLKKSKSWRSGKRRFTKGRPHTMTEDEAKAFMSDGHFTVTPIKADAKDEGKKKAASKERKGEQPRLNDEVKSDVKEPPADHKSADKGTKAKRLKVKGK